MPHPNIIKSKSEEELWKLIDQQLKTLGDNKNYSVFIENTSLPVTIDIDLAPDSDDEEKALTSFSTVLTEDIVFRFSLQRQGIRNEIRKLFGMQDVVVGDESFDKKFVIQSNNEELVKQVLAEESSREALAESPTIAFDLKEFKIGAHRQVSLVLDMAGAITDISVLRSVYNAYRDVLNRCVQ